MELYRKELKLAVIKGLDESRGSSNVPIKLTHDTSDEYINYTEQIHIRYLFDNQVKEEILPTNDNGFYIPGKPLSHDGPIELAVHLINGNIELVTNELSFVVKNAPNGTTQVDPSEFTWQQLVDQYVNAKLDTFANKLDLSKFEETVNVSIENQNQNIESFKTDVNANLSNQDKKITDLQTSTQRKLDSQDTKINDFKAEVNTSLSNQTTSINHTTSVQNSKITTLEGRMDTFTSLSEGSTTGDAELQDIRVGANGITYDTAGNAVRGQYSQLKEDLGDLSKISLDILNKYGIEENKAIADDGSIYTAEGWNTTNYLPVNTVKRVYAKCSKDTTVIMVGYYNEDKTPIEGYKRTTPTFNKTKGFYEPLNVGAYFRVAYNSDISDLKSLETDMIDSIVDNHLNKFFKYNFLLSDKSFKQGWFDVNGSMQTTDNTEIFNGWSAHKNFINVSNVKKIIIKNNKNEKVILQPYLYSSMNESIELGPAFDCYYGITEYIPPTNAGYIHLSCRSGLISNLDFELYTLDYDTVSDTDNSYVNINPLGFNYGNGLATVSINGGGDYTNIGEAYNALNRNGCIFIKSGRYITQGSLSLDEAYLFGENRETVLIENNKASYPDDALRVRSGVVENLTIYSTNDTATNGSYATHIDEDSYAGKQLVFRNCSFIADYQASVGIGMRKNQILKFENCRFVSKYTAGVFLHDWLQATEENNQYVIFENCVFESEKDYALKLMSVNSKNNLVVTFINNTFITKENGNENVIEIATPTEHGYLCGNSIKLGDSSHGNNVDMLNAY